MRVRAFVVATIVAILSVPGSALSGEFPLVSYDGFEACALGYLDADGDGHGGALDVAHLCDPLPESYVRLGGDCDDGNPDIHPAALELMPDEAAIDENCDGVDGNASLAVFVSPAGAATQPCGTRAEPCNLIVGALVAGALGRSQLYLSSGDHQGRLRFTDAAPIRGLFGGFSADFRTRDIETGPGRSTRIHGAGVSGDDALALDLSGNANWIATDLAFIAPGTTARTVDGEGLGSVAIRLSQGAVLDLRRSDAIAGDAADGAAGQAGDPYVPVFATTLMLGSTGGNGAQPPVDCNDTSRGLGGGGGVNTCPAGGRPTGAGRGGDGGTMDTSCDIFNLDLSATPGKDGNPAELTIATSGTGGDGGDPCSPGGDGRSGSTVHGTGGVASTIASLAGLRLRAGNGGNGQLGQNGTGGGGGGGSGGCDIGMDAYGPGGGGGGAGGCAAPTSGQGGKGGGSSIGILVHSAAITLADVHVSTGNGGDGGAGGAGGQGQDGGTGAPGGLNPGSGIPGRGGDGGTGGHSGSGAGGNGGHSIGLFRYLGVVIGTPTTFPGLPGAGGSGGTTPPGGNPGAAGKPGTSAASWTCASPEAC